MYDKPTPNLKVIQVLVVALMMGLIAAVAAFIVVRETGKAPSPAPGVQSDALLYALVGDAVLSMMGVLVIPPIMIRGAAPKYRAGATDADREAVLMQTLSTTTIVKCAFVEGVGLFGAVIFLLNGMWPVLTAPVLGVMVMLLFLPTEGTLQRMRERLEMARA